MRLNIPIFPTRTQDTSRFTVDNLLRDAEVEVCNFARAHFEKELNRRNWKPKVSIGKVAAEIVATAREEKVDLIIMGRQKRRMFHRWVSCSVSDAVSYGAIVTCIPPHALPQSNG